MTQLIPFLPDAALIIKNILLHDAGAAAVPPEHIRYDCFAETVFGDAAVFFLS